MQPDVIDVNEEIGQEIKLSNIFDDALKMGVITKKGAWFYFGDINLGQGKKARDLDPKVRGLIYESISN